MGPTKRPDPDRLVFAISWPVRWLWRALGRLGLAARHLLSRLTRPLRALLALNLVLLFLLTRVNAEPTTSPLASAAPATLTSTPTAAPTLAPRALPTATPRPTLIAVTPAPPPDPLAVGGSVAFVARHHGSDTLWVISPGDDQAVQWTDTTADDRDPAWSPDGRSLAFASRRAGSWDLYVLHLDTGDTVRLTTDRAYQARPTWSPDGQWLAYEGYHEDNLDLYIIPATGGEPIRLTHHPAPDYAPAWSPSGRHIAFVSWRDGNPDIYLFSLDDARDESCINITRTTDVAEDRPAWHPAGDYLAFTGRTGGQELVYLLPFLNNLPAGDATVLAQGIDPVWAPNGESLLYVHRQVDRHYLLATALVGWGPAPQVLVSDRSLRAPAWGPAVPLATAAAETAPPLYLESMADLPLEGAPYTLVTLDDLQVPGPYLNDRVDEAFAALRQRVIDEAGWDFLGALDTMWEPIDSLPPPGLDAASWNKAGRAFDIARELNLGPNPVTEVVPDTGACHPSATDCIGAGTYWRVYVRARNQDGSQGEPLRTRPWNFAARYSGNTTDYEAGGAAKPVIPPGYYVDFTRLAADYGWERVPAGSSWRTFFPAALFWHFQKRDGLQWEEAMLELYTAQELQQGFGGIEP